MSMLECLKLLVNSFDCDEGFPGDIFVATCHLITATLGENAAQIFSRYIGANDGKFFLKGNCFQPCWEAMVNSVVH